MKLIAVAFAALCLNAAEVTRDIEFARPGGFSLRLDASIPEGKGPHAAVILVHGGGWEAGDKQTYIKPWFPVLTDAGFAWFSIDYRLAPAHKYPAAVEDVESAVNFVRANSRRFRIDPRRIALVGESSGGHLVSLVGARGKARVAAVIPFYGIHDFTAWFEPGKPVRRNAAQFLGDASPSEASPVTYVTAKMPPYLFIHGSADPGVPAAQSLSMCERMKAAGARCEVYIVDGAGHGVENWEKNPAFLGYKQKMVDWLRASM